VGGKVGLVLSASDTSFLYKSASAMILKFYTDNYLSYELSYLVGQKYVTDAFRQDGVAKCKAVISVFADRIKANKWLSEEGKKNALEKLNAFYINNYNSINIYPWWLMKPCSDPSYNQAINYAIMEIVAHEITHGFDSNGYRFNKDGDPVTLFTNPADAANFDELGKKLVARFNELEVMPKELPGVMSKGEYCLGENIADLGGFEIAFEAYTRYLKDSGFNGDELLKQQQYFFYAFTEQNRSKYGPNYVKLMQEGRPATALTPAISADTHSLPRERVNGIIRNVDIWYDLFGIKPGDALYLAPADRVHIW
jgi:endothelin-converting enzyme/putative endopeptidase